MKKTLLTLCALLSAILLHAQSDSTRLKASKGTISTELNVNPFNGNISLNNSINQIKLRYFVADQLALRFGFNVKNQKDLEDMNYPYGTSPSRNKTERKSTTLSLNLGLEKHFGKLKRISPYVGIDFALENLAASQENINGQITTKVKNAWYVYSLQLQNNPIYQIQNQAYFSYGLNLFSGFDFYIAKNFFVGYEFNLGFTKTSYKEPESKTEGAGTTIPSTNDIFDYEKTSFSFGPRLLNGFRLGYNF